MGAPKLTALANLYGIEVNKDLSHSDCFHRLMFELAIAELPRLGLPIVLTAGRRGPARPYSDEYAQRKVRKARIRAGLGDHVTLDACRHGGLTELGDAGATEFEGMAASMHKAPQAFHPRPAIRGEVPGLRASSLRRGGSAPLRSAIAIVSWPAARPPAGRAWRRDRRTPGQTPDRIAEGARG